MQQARWWIVGVALVIVAALMASVSLPHSSVAITYAHKIIHIHADSVQVDIADTPALRELGLGGRTGLGVGSGMLFVFARDGYYSFWMKDMKFAIDIVWIDHDGMIVGIFSSVSPDTYPQSFSPEGSARYVVELPAGYAKEHGVKVGDSISLQ